MNQRGRLTPVDIVFVVASLSVLAFLSEPFYTLLGGAGLSTGVELLFRMLPPALVAMLIYVVYRTSLIGGGAA
jgi:hypothetical protein